MEDTEMGKTHYLPHHAVVRTDKATTKVRVVYDASATSSSGISLNSCLYPGPCLLKTVAEILIRFRVNPIALISDIEKAFLMISVNEGDRDVLRFLWYKDVNSSEREQVIYRFCRVVFGVTCSPFLLNATLKHHIEKYSTTYPEVCSKLLNALYVDDVSSGGHTVEETFQLYEIAKKIMKEGGFNLRKWQSNSSELIEKITEVEEREQVKVKETKPISQEDASFAKTELSKTSGQEITSQKILGLNWDSVKDTINFEFSSIEKISQKTNVTKRIVLSCIAKIFDPLGLITPITTMFKDFMQKLFKVKLDWDEILPEDLHTEWIKLTSELENTPNISVPRYYFEDLRTKPTKIELFGFCDSSDSAYAAVVYAKVVSKEHSFVKLVSSKTRVCPLTKMSIPRLELLACLILARLINSVYEAFSPLYEVEIMQCWTDSITAKYWIQGVNKDWKLFVENRVQEIREKVSSELWSHCPGDQNPADIPTRKINVSQFAANTRWWEGPHWLKQSKSQWPNYSIENDSPPECLEELKSKQNAVKLTALMTTTEKIEEFINFERFSDYGKLVRVVTYILRFIHNCRNKVNRNIEELSSSEITTAENLIIRRVQCNFNKTHLNDVQKNLGTFFDKNQIIRCKGRMQNSSLRYDAKFPILMPREHYVTKLVVLKCHKDVKHDGTKETLAELRSKFWVIKGRQTVKKIIKGCSICKRIQGNAYSAPITSQLPEFRVNEKHAFSSVGIDFAGPLYVKSRSSGSKKVYLTLFTCGVSRALHLELVPDLSMESFLLCFRRFVSRRGIPDLIVTDNAKTFKAASRRLAELFNSHAVRSFLNDKRIHWHYNMSKAPWYGGFYERLIRCVKSSMKKCIGSVQLTYDELQTVVIEIKAVLNSRPLTYLYENELEQALTPSHLIIGRRLLSLPDQPTDTDDNDKDFNQREDVARKREKYLSTVLNHYWRRWKREYLVDLREYHKLETASTNKPELKNGDIVIIEDENRRNRATWKLGKIEAVLRSRDDTIRGAKVRLANRNCIERPVQKLYPLEITQTEMKPEQRNVKEKELPSQTRPRRKAAELARVRIQIDQLDEL